MSLQSLPLQREPLPGLPMVGYLVLLVVAALGLLLVWGHRRNSLPDGALRTFLNRGQQAKKPAEVPPIQLQQSVRVGASTQLISVRWHAEHMLLSVGPEGTRLLARAPVGANADASAESSA